MALSRFTVYNNEHPMAVIATADGYNYPFRRRSLWSVEERQNLIKSLLQGVSIGEITLTGGADLEAFSVLDGVSRIKTLRMFWRNQFGVPAEWFAQLAIRAGSEQHREMKSAGLATHDMLLVNDRARLDAQVMNVRTIYVRSIKDAEELRARLNPEVHSEGTHLSDS